MVALEEMHGMSQEFKDLFQEDFLDLEGKRDTDTDRNRYLDCFNDFVSRNFAVSLSKMYKYGFLNCDIFEQREDILKLFLNVTSQVKEIQLIDGDVYGTIGDLLVNEMANGELVTHDIALFNKYLGSCSNFAFENDGFEGNKSSLRISLQKKIQRVLDDKIFMPTSESENDELCKLLEFYFITLHNDKTSSVLFFKFQEFCENNKNLTKILRDTKLNCVSYYDLISNRLNPIERQSNSKPKSINSNPDETNRQAQPVNIDSKWNLTGNKDTRKQLIERVTKLYHLCKNYKISNTTLLIGIAIVLSISQKFKLASKLNQAVRSIPRNIAPIITQLISILSSV